MSKAEIVGVVSSELAVLTSDDRVYRADSARLRGYLVKELHNVLFVGDSYVEGVKTATLDKIAKLVARELAELEQECDEFTYLGSYLEVF